MTQLHRPPTNAEAKAARRAKAAAVREAARRAERRRTLLVRGALVLLVLAVIAAIAVPFLTASRSSASALPSPKPASGTAAPPWPAPSDPSAGIKAAGLNIPRTESGAHFHPHLDIRVDGKAVPVAASIGVGANAMSELHTHDTTGLIHVEADAKSDRYVLGQLFTEWGVRLTKNQLGSLTSGDGKTLAAYVDGKRYTGDPARIELLSRRQIALVFGTAAQQRNPPSSYKFPAGD